MSSRRQRVIGLLLGGMLVVVAGAGLLAPGGVFALSLPNGTAATLVLGQATFSDSAPGTAQNRLNAPQDVAVDPVSGNVFVADTLNNRVLRFASSAALVNGAAAEAVLGQPTFADSSAACTAASLGNPSGLIVDSAGRLWVADSLQHRVVRFDRAATLGSGAAASGVLGQPNLTTCATSATPTANSIANPTDLAVDSAGRLWVVDIDGNRVLRFDNAAAKADGAAADGVLGQTTFGAAVAGTTQSTLRQPVGVTVDGAGTLWVSDTNNSRVLRFDNAAAKANGANADGVLGQSSFAGANAGTAASGLSYPALIAVEPTSGRLWVVDSGNNRVLRFDSAAGKGNGAAADGVLGQGTFSGTSVGTSATALSSPFGVGYDPALDVVWVADAGNNRLLRFGRPAAPTNTPPGGTATFTPTNTPTAGAPTFTPTGTTAPTVTSTPTDPPGGTGTPTATPTDTAVASPSATSTSPPTTPTATGTLVPTVIAPAPRPPIYLPIVRAG